MPATNYNAELLGLQDVIVTKIEQTDDCQKIYIEMPRRPTVCPCCGKLTTAIHDYRTQPVKDAPAFCKKVWLFYRKRRYRCECGKRFFDVLRTRYEHDLIDYFKTYERSGVKYVVSDMYSTYAELAKTYFPKAVYIIDKYHWIRQAVWALETVRKSVQQRFSKSHRIYFKRSKHLLSCHSGCLTEEEKQQVNIMLYASPDLSTAYYLKEKLYEIIMMNDASEQRHTLKEWIEEAGESGIGSFEACARTYTRWFDPIFNSLIYPYTNAYTEGSNNKIKVLKRNAYGLRCFSRFRNRILFTFQKSAAQ